MNFTKRRWLILAVCCLANLCLGSVYTWSVFATPMSAHLSALTGQTLTAADLAIVYTIANSVGPITMTPAAGLTTASDRKRSSLSAV